MEACTCVHDIQGIAYSHDKDVYVCTSTNYHTINLIDPVTKASLSTLQLGISAPYVACGRLAGVHEQEPVILLTDNDSASVKVIDFTGTLVTNIGRSGRGEGQLRGPQGACVGPGGRLIVCDMNNSRVVSFWVERGEVMSHVLLTQQQCQNNQPQRVTPPKEC